MTRYILLSLSILFASISHAIDNPVSYYLVKYKLPINVNVLSVFGEDCLNCYYGFSNFIQNDKEMNKKELVFIFQKNAESEIDNIFKYRLKLNKNDYTIIVDNDFYSSVNKEGVTALTIIKDKNITEYYTAKTIHQFKSITPPIHLKEIDTIDLKSRFGTKKLSLNLLNKSKALIQNLYTNEINIFDINKKIVTNTLSLTYFNDRYDSLLTLLNTDSINLAYNLKNYKTNEFYKTFPIISIKKVTCINNTIYLGLCVYNMVYGENENHINYEAKQALVKLDSNLTVKHIYKLLDSVPYVGKYVSLMDIIPLNNDSIIFSLSSVERKGDSICGLYSLKNNTIEPLNWSYEPFMPKLGSHGYPTYYPFRVYIDKSLKGFLHSSPYIYNLSTNEKKLLPNLGIDPLSFDISSKDKYFWLSKVFKYDDMNMVILSLTKGKQVLLQYDNEMNKLINKTDIFEGYFKDVFNFGNRVYAFENYAEGKDVAILHIYKLK
ncbi:hypothetical protein [Flavobacterium sp.]|uniref:hypothetical protein n=1 Tax=Flavobacterium sp. TaxID=239 RepID=UPI002B4AB28E|nr:hypothetical protein [Flavobacterium sp.]HLF52321.1 hypothetical protein [Flavobacterium sp.]